MKPNDEKTREELLEELERVKAERDSYYKALLKALPPAPEDLGFTDEEALAQVGKLPPFEEFLESLLGPLPNV